MKIKKKKQIIEMLWYIHGNDANAHDASLELTMKAE